VTLSFVLDPKALLALFSVPLMWLWRSASGLEWLVLKWRKSGTSSTL